MITSIKLLSGGGVRILLRESSFVKLSEDGDRTDKKSNGIGPGMDIGVAYFCFRRGDSIPALPAQGPVVNWQLQVDALRF